MDLLESDALHAFAAFARHRNFTTAAAELRLGLAPTPPPDSLYHGTVERFLSRIRAQGLIRGRRHHVHLSPDEPSALAVGRRREGRTVVLRIDAAGMHRHGYPFYQAANGVWLTDHVPPQWIDGTSGGGPEGQGGG
jgi:putative RNA 2'-phosphotransferase